MTDQDCVRLLKWSLPQLRMRWNGYRRVRGQVCKRIDRRMHELGLADEAHIGRFLNKKVMNGPYSTPYAVSRYRAFTMTVKQRGDSELRCWSIGCASGEEPYTLAILWDRDMGRRYPSLKMMILATDADRGMLERAQVGCYSSGNRRGLFKSAITAILRGIYLYSVEIEYTHGI